MTQRNVTYRKTRNFENAQKHIFTSKDVEGVFEIPVIKPTQYEHCEWLGFNYASRCTSPSGKGVHFFLDDYQFQRLWQEPVRYIEMLKRFKYILTPDFSLYTDFPVVLQIWNHFRKHWLGAYLQMHGCSVVPTICWSNERSYEWCFDGEPVASTVAVSSIGTQKSKFAQVNFLKGYREMIRRLQPKQIIFYGQVPKECEGNIVQVRSFQNDRFNEAKCHGW